MSKLQNMRVINIPKFRAVSSGLKTFAEIFGENGFWSWIGAHRHLVKDLIYESPNFLWHEGDQNVWVWAIRDDVTADDVAPYETTEFQGGMFLAATADEKDETDLNKTVDCMMEWIKRSAVFEYGDFPKSGMSNMPNQDLFDGAIDKALGIAQQQIFLPLKFSDKTKMIKMNTDQIKDLVPKSKFDVSTIHQLYTLTEDEAQPIIRDLLYWIADINWPVARKMVYVLKHFHKIVVPHVKDVLKACEDDTEWKYFIIVWLIPMLPEESQVLLHDDIRRIIKSPTDDEKYSEVDRVAQKYWENRNNHQC